MGELHFSFQLEPIDLQAAHCSRIVIESKFRGGDYVDVGRDERVEEEVLVRGDDGADLGAVRFYVGHHFGWVITSREEHAKAELTESTFNTIAFSTVL